MCWRMSGVGFSSLWINSWLQIQWEKAQQGLTQTFWPQKHRFLHSQAQRNHPSRNLDFFIHWITIHPKAPSPVSLRINASVVLTLSSTANRTEKAELFYLQTFPLITCTLLCTHSVPGLTTDLICHKITPFNSADFTPLSWKLPVNTVCSKLTNSQFSLHFTSLAFPQSGSCSFQSSPASLSAAFHLPVKWLELNSRNWAILLLSLAVIDIFMCPGPRQALCAWACFICAVGHTMLSSCPSALWASDCYCL